MKRLICILGGVLLLLVYSCSSDSDDDMNPNPSPMVDFTVRTVTKTSNHPWFGEGSAIGYTINGVQGDELSLVRGTKYVFEIITPTHPFYISSDDTGVGAGEITDGVTGSKTQNGTLTFTPNNSHPNLLYYQCSAHPKMGYKINISDP